MYFCRSGSSLELRLNCWANSETRNNRIVECLLNTIIPLLLVPLKWLISLHCSLLSLKKVYKELLKMFQFIHCHLGANTTKLYLHFLHAVVVVQLLGFVSSFMACQALQCTCCSFPDDIMTLHVNAETSELRVSLKVSTKWLWCPFRICRFWFNLYDGGTASQLCLRAKDRLKIQDQKKQPRTAATCATLWE